MDAANIIKNALKMPDLLRRYGIPINAKGFCLCPFHAEKTPSCKVFPDHVHCFGCGFHGDVISVAQGLFKEDFKTALKRLDRDFCLGIYDDTFFPEKRRGRALYEQNRLIQQKQRELDEADAAYWEAFDIVKRLRDIAEAHRPTKQTEEPDALYIMSTNYLGKYEDELDRADIHRKEILKEWNEMTA